MFKGMTGQQALQTGAGFLQMGISTALEKQRREEEKKRLDFEKNMRMLAFNIEERKLKLAEAEAKMKADVEKGKAENLFQFKKKAGDIVYGGRRPDYQTQEARGQTDALKARSLLMLGAQFPQVSKGMPVSGLTQMMKGEQPPQPFTLGPEQQRYTGEGKLLATGLPKPEKPNYARYKSAQGGLMDMKTKQWIVEPPKEGEPVTFEHLTKAMEALDKLGMKDVYWEGVLRWGKIKKEWLQNFIAGKEVSPELAASIKQKFPDISLNLKLGKKETDLPYKDEDLIGGFEIYKKLVPNATWDEYIKSLK